jgi:hypothetical protein
MSVVTPSLRAAIAVPGWAKNELWRKARAVPSLDLRFADSKSLVDATTGSNLVTFTRASSGTFVGSDGVLRTAVTNLLLRSEDLTLSPWNSNFSGAGVTATNETYTAPDGSTTVTKLTFNQQYGVRQQDVSTSDGVSYTFSGYVKRLSGPTAYSFLHYNSASGSSTGGLTVTDQWTRFEITVLGRSGGGAIAFGIQTTATSDFGELLVWGAQVEQSATVGEYIPTTSTINSAPRFDHNPTTGESLGLLVEEQRTNLVLRSEEFDNAYWSKANATITADSIAAPTGATTADLLIETAATGQHRVYRGITGTTNTNPHTVSFFAKANTRTRVYVGLAEGTTFSRQGNAVFDLSTGTIVNATGGSSGATGGAATIQNFGNGWYRCTYTLIFGGTDTTVFTDINLVNTGTTISYTGDGTSGIYIWGAQLEEGSFPTSYIPTTTAAVTRNADVASITGSAFSGWYRQDEGTLFAEFQPRANATAGVAYLNGVNHPPPHKVTGAQRLLTR